MNAMNSDLIEKHLEVDVSLRQLPVEVLDPHAARGRGFLPETETHFRSEQEQPFALGLSAEVGRA
jgi:hypothetical protein